MKSQNKYHRILRFYFLLLFFLFQYIGFNQDCNNRYYWKDCRKSVDKRCRYYGQPKTTMINIYDTLRYNIVFYGNNDYIISFCTDMAFYPLEIRIIKPDNGEVLYNNESDRYPSTLYLGFHKTQNYLIEVLLRADRLNKDKIKEKNNICIGMLLQIKKTTVLDDDVYE